MKQQHHKYDIRLFSKGANRDVNTELFSLLDGQYIDARNMRVKGYGGDNYSINKINGEELLYPNLYGDCNVPAPPNPLPGDYECIGMIEVNGNIVEFWADAAKIEPSLIRINGIVVLKSYDFPISTDYPLQIAKNESCIGGEIYVTDFNVEPMVFNIKDLLLNRGIDVGGEQGNCTEKYFSEYNHTDYVLNITRALNAMRFIRLKTSGADYTFGSSGLNVGYYTYSYRYVSSSGDRTSWSVPTPQIPVPLKLSGNCNTYRYGKTVSAEPGTATTYGTYLKLRIDNRDNYDYIEIRRDRWDNGSAFGTPGISEIIGQIDLTEGQFGIISILDKGGYESSLSDEDIIGVMQAISAAKAIRYFNERLYLMNIKTASRDINDVVSIENEGTSGVCQPTVQKINKIGHKDPYYGTYYKHYTLGERFGFGIIAWDSQGQYTFVKPIDGAKDYQMPNRRTEASIETVNTSYDGILRGSTDVWNSYNKDFNVGYVHEVYDVTDAVNKDDITSFFNISKKGGKSLSKFSHQPAPPANYQDGFRVKAKKIGYKPFRPTGINDSGCVGSNFVINEFVDISVNSRVPYLPKGFNLDYYATGVSFKGIELPSWAKAFSIVRTEPAKRVVAQGFAYYHLVSAEGNLGTDTYKETDKFDCYFPDIDASRGIDPSIIDEVINNPSDFEIEFVSPTGIFTEVWHFNIEGISGKPFGADIITYARVPYDNGQINPNDTAKGTFDVIESKHTVSFAKWRQVSDSKNTRLTTNLKAGIKNISVKSTNTGRQDYVEIQVDRQIYETKFVSGGKDYIDANLKNWHEPMFVINIIRKGAQISDTNVKTYVSTGHYQKVESVIGISDGLVGQSYELVDERWEDCIQLSASQTNNSYYANLDRFIYIKKQNETQTWVDVTNKTSAQITTILNDIQNNGYHTIVNGSNIYNVKGVYKHSISSDNTAKIYSVNFDYFDTNFNQKYFIPELGDEIIVRYDKRIPVRVFGGDSWIGESVWAVKDFEYGKDGKPKTSADEFSINVGFPFRAYYLNPRYFIMNKTYNTLNYIQDREDFNFSNQTGQNAQIRQLLCMWTSETRLDVPLSFGIDSSGNRASHNRYFPVVNYIIRPNQWDDSVFDDSNWSNSYTDQNIYAEYTDDYDNEFNNWQYGGFRFLQQFNIDYSKEDTTRPFATRPKFGYKEQNEFCTRIIWSEKRPINVQDTPSVRTFPSQNYYDLSDDTGEIKFAWSSISGKGNNLYAITENGVALLLIDKRIIHEINANELATVGSDIGGILNELWISREIGMNDELWRSAAEYNNMLWFANNYSVYKLENNELIDIGDTNYKTEIYKYLSILNTGYLDDICATYDPLNKEYLLHIGIKAKRGGYVLQDTFSYNDLDKFWNGKYDYKFDRMIYVDNDVYGARNLETYMLNKGYYINGSEITSEVSVPFSPELFYDKEFVRVRINSNNKPTRVEFYDTINDLDTGNYLAYLDSSQPYYLKNYYGYEQYIPRKINPPRNRIQGRMVITKIIHNLVEDFNIISSGVQFKILK